MAGKNTAVFGIYPNRFAVEEAVEHLRKTGFRNTDISVLFQDNQGTKDFAHEKNTKAPEGVTTGVVAGGLAGGVLGCASEGADRRGHAGGSGGCGHGSSASLYV